MKRPMIYLLLITMTIAICSCKKDKDPGPVKPITYPNYSNFKAGSYWVYQQFNIDSIGNVTATNVYDSCYVIKDTIINNQTYSKTYRPVFYSQKESYTYTRDSLHFVISDQGYLLFSSQDFETILYDHYSITTDNDTIYHVVKKMTDKDLSVETPAGIFTTSDCLETYTFFPFLHNVTSPRYKHNRYAENIGIVIETPTFNAGNPNTIERRLARYHVVL